MTGNYHLTVEEEVEISQDACLIFEKLKACMSQQAAMSKALPLMVETPKTTENTPATIEALSLSAPIENIDSLLPPNFVHGSINLTPEYRGAESRPLFANDTATQPPVSSTETMFNFGHAPSQEFDWTLTQPNLPALTNESENTALEPLPNLMEHPSLSPAHRDMAPAPQAAISYITPEQWREMAEILSPAQLGQLCRILSQPHRPQPSASAVATSTPSFTTYPINLPANFPEPHLRTSHPTNFPARPVHLNHQFQPSNAAYFNQDAVPPSTTFLEMGSQQPVQSADAQHNCHDILGAGSQF